MLTVAALDLDDTLLRSDASISARTLDALRAWRAKGNRVVVATGRPRRTIDTVLPLELSDVPVISYNGAEIHLNGRKLYDNLIPAIAARTIVERCLALAPDAEIGVEIDNILYLNRPSKRPRLYEVANLLELTHQPCAKVLVFADELAVLDPLLAELPAGARALHSGRYRFLQILGETVDKAEALRFLVADWGLTMANVVAFGDDTNDVDMVRLSGLGVAMSNAVEEVLAVAHRVTTSNDEDGVALVLEELLNSAADHESVKTRIVSRDNPRYRISTSLFPKLPNSQQHFSSKFVIILRQAMQLESVGSKCVELVFE